MIRRCLIVSFGMCLSLVVNISQADDLMQVYGQAVHNDPTFKQAQSTWWSAKQALPIAVSAYLPQVDVTDVLERQYSKSRPASVSSDGYVSQNVLTLTATQAIFDFSVWTNIAEQSAKVKSATATYLASIQKLMADTAKAYFNVLAAFDKLRFTISNKKAVKRQLVTAQQKFKVGLIAITGVYDAQARYDSANADEISDRNNLYNQLENLRAITGQHYLSLMGINVQVPLITPAPNNIDTWVGTAIHQNYTLQADNYASLAAHRAILNVALGNGSSSGAGGFMPTVDATASWSRTNNFHYTNPIPGSSNSWTNSADVGLSLDWDPFSGGATYYSTKQAHYNYLTSLGALEQEHRNVINQTRQSFLGIKSSISRIGADKQSIISARNALKATEAGYTVGTRTMVDVLNDLTQVYQNENQYMDDQYSYINSIISLKQQAGTLSVKDLEQLNSWLKKNIKFPLPKSYYGKGAAPEDTAVMDKLDVLTKDTPMQLYKVSHHHDATSQKALKQRRMLVRHRRYHKVDFAKTHHVAAAPEGSQKALKLQRIKSRHHRYHKLKVAGKKSAIVAQKPLVQLPVTATQVAKGKYVVQLYVADKKSAAQRYVEHSKIGQQLRVIKRDNLYKVLYGHFKNRSDALIAMDTLPIDHAKNSAWVFKYVVPKPLPNPAKK